MRRSLHLSFALVLLFSSIGYNQQRQLRQNDSRSDRRIALVIGNSAYEAAPLKNPVNDAHDMAQALEELGFKIVNKEKMLNLTQNEMKRAISTFGAELRSGGIGLFYFAGHGVQVKGINYLVPVDAKVESEADVEYECVDAGRVLAQMESAENLMNIVILDACRNNPFARSFRSDSGGLAMMDAPSGSLIAYATAPGRVASDGSARNGLYTQELLRFLRTRGLEVENMFKQVRISLRNLTQGKQTPWESSSLVGTFYFAGAANPDATVSTVSNKKSFVKNGGFENDYDGWGTGNNEGLSGRLSGKDAFWARLFDVDITGEIDSRVKQTGLKSFKIVNKTPLRPHSYRTMSQRIDGLKPDTRYRISFWVKAESAKAGTLKIVTDFAWSYGRGIDPGTYEWREHILDFRTKPGETLIDLRIISEDSGTVWIDEIELREFSLAPK